MIPVLLTLLACLSAAIVSAIVADSYVNILTQPGQVLAFWARWLYGLRDQYADMKQQQAIAESSQNPNITFGLREKLSLKIEQLRARGERADFILKPLLTCVYCVGGQIGFWLSLYYQYWYDTSISVIFSLVTAVLAVWLAGAVQRIRQQYFPL